MKVVATQFLFGVNLHAGVPVCVFDIAPDRPEEQLDVPLPVELLDLAQTHFPALRTMLGDVIGKAPEYPHAGHLALALIGTFAADLGWRLSHTDIKSEPKAGLVRLTFSYEDRRVANATVRFALRVIQHLSEAVRPAGGYATTSIGRAHQRFIAENEPRSWSLDTRYLVEQARGRGIPALVTEKDFIFFGHGKHQRRMLRKTTPFTSFAAVKVTTNKQVANREMARVGLPVPTQRAVSDLDSALRAANQIGFPLVVKPATTDMGVGISVGVTDTDALERAFEKARRHAGLVVVERFIEGKEYRLLVVDGKYVAAAERVPAHVIGDGKHTIGELVDALNREPQRGVGKLAKFNRVNLDQEDQNELARAGYGLTDVPVAGERVFLRRTSNLSQGGSSIDMTELVHPDNRAAALLAAKVVGLDIAGVDLITHDIARSWRETGAAICEINMTPGLRMHFAPAKGRSQDVAGPILKLLFPPTRDPRIPIATITGSNGKTTTTRMTAHILREAGMCVGQTSTDGVYVDGDRVRSGDLSGGPAAQQLLIDPRIDAAVLEIARGAILKYGTGIDYCDVAAVLNVADEHLGELGVRSRSDMARVKGLLVRMASRMVVLNADDPLVAGLAGQSVAARLCYVSLVHDNPIVAKHIASGHLALRLERHDDVSSIVLHDNGNRDVLMPAAELPSSSGGRAIHNIQNAMFAAATAYGLGQPPSLIARALATFGSNPSQNPGRLNIVKGLPFDLILDLCHNRHGLEVIGAYVEQWNVDRRVLVYSMPGNRREVDFEQAMQAAAAHFDRFHVYALDDYYLRGRSRDDLTGLLARGLSLAGVAQQAIIRHACLADALSAALSECRAGDLLMVATLQHEQARREIEAHIGRCTGN